MEVKRQPAAVRCCLAFALIVACFATHSALVAAAGVEFVIHISVDGLRPDAITVLGPTNLPNFYRLRREGAITDNARSDYNSTETLPNHATQLTGRPVIGPAGHNWIENDDPAQGATLTSNKRTYVAGVFDVVHDHGLRTAQFGSKTKLSLFAISWNATNGVPDIIGPDNGRNKVDFAINLPEHPTNTTALVNVLVSSMSTEPYNFAFLHLADPDFFGHTVGWNVTPGSPYSDAVKSMDRHLGLILGMIDNDPQLKGRTALILTADHGGTSNGHDNPYLREVYTVPFYVWGPGVLPGANLYALNPNTRLDPGTNRPSYTNPIQPIRNGEAANLALKLLGLGPVPESTINSAQNLALTLPAPADFKMTVSGTDAIFDFTTASGALHDIQRLDNLPSSIWSNLVTNIPGTGGLVRHTVSGIATNASGFYRMQIHF